MITLEDLHPYLTKGLYDALEDSEVFPAERIKTLIASAIAEYKLLVPCFDVESEVALEKLKHISLPHIAVILSYQTLLLLPSENTELKSVTERMYENLMNNLRGKDGGADGLICNILKPVIPQDIDIVITGNLETIGRGA